MPFSAHRAFMTIQAGCVLLIDRRESTLTESHHRFTPTHRVTALGTMAAFTLQLSKRRAGISAFAMGTDKNTLQLGLPVTAQATVRTAATEGGLVSFILGPTGSGHQQAGQHQEYCCSGFHLQPVQLAYVGTAARTMADIAGFDDCPF
jgi:hypothetical protein